MAEGVTDGSVALAGAGVALRELCEADRASFLAELVDPDVWQHTQIEMKTIPDAEAQLDWLLTQAHRPDRQSIYLAVTDSSGTFAGLAALSRTGEIGWYLGRRFWGRGMATEATRLLVAYAFEVLGLERVFATCDPDNTASARVLMKAGFRHEGRLPDDVPTPKGPRPRDRYGVDQCST